jgi:hypothetical protein
VEGQDLSDDLKKMLDEAVQRVADRDSAQKSKLQKAEEDIRVSGQQLSARVLPRLQEAQKDWEGELKLEILDQSGQFSLDPNGNVRLSPTITVSANSKAQASYAFATDRPGHASINEGAGSRRGQKAYDFNVEKLEDLTDAMIDQVLKALLEVALGLKPAS